MQRRYGAALAAVLSLTAAACLTPVSRSELEPVIARDVVLFRPNALPAQILDRLSSARVLVVGELHRVREHQELLQALIPALHARGFRQLLLELPQADDWWIDAYATNALPDLKVRLRADLGGRLLETIRELNQHLPEPDRIRVRAIDVAYGGYELEFCQSLDRLLPYLQAPEPLRTFRESYSSTPETQLDQLGTLRDRLRADETALAVAWGRRWYGIVLEMVETEMASLNVRNLWNDGDLGFKLREEHMKLLADRRLAESPGGTVINVGANHAQKQYLRGTRQEWLADYLAHRSPEAAGQTFSVFVRPARGEVNSVGNVLAIDAATDSAPDEVFRLMHAVAAGAHAFLPLDDAIFLRDGVEVNYVGDTHVSAPKPVYDAFILLPEGHIAEP